MTNKQKAFWITVLGVLFFPLSLVVAVIYAIYLMVEDMFDMRDNTDE